MYFEYDHGFLVFKKSVDDLGSQLKSGVTGNCLCGNGEVLFVMRTEQNLPTVYKGTQQGCTVYNLTGLYIYFEYYHFFCVSRRCVMIWDSRVTTIVMCYRKCFCGNGEVL